MSMAFCKACNDVVDTDLVGVLVWHDQEGEVTCDKHPASYHQLMAEAKAEFEEAMKNKKSLRVKKLLDHTLPKKGRLAE